MSAWTVRTKNTSPISLLKRPLIVLTVRTAPNSAYIWGGFRAIRTCPSCRIRHAGPIPIRPNRPLLVCTLPPLPLCSVQPTPSPSCATQSTTGPRTCSPSPVLPPPGALSPPRTRSPPRTPPRYVLVRPAAAAMHPAHHMFDEMSEQIFDLSFCCCTFIGTHDKLR